MKNVAEAPTMHACPTGNTASQHNLDAAQFLQEKTRDGNNKRSRQLPSHRWFLQEDIQIAFNLQEGTHR